jgi:hypothetical protein
MKNIYENELLVANEGFDGSPIGQDRGDSNVIGQPYFANESRFIESSFSEPLTAYAVGYQDPGQIQELLDFIAPMVPASKRFEYAVAQNAEEFMAETNLEDVRAIGASFKRVEYTSKKATGVVLNKGLTVRVDLDNVEDQPNWAQIQTGKLMRRLLRAEALRAYSLLAGMAVNTNLIWNGTAGQDPDMDVTAAMNLFGDTSGLNPNRALFGLSAWTQRKTTMRASNTPGGYQSSNMTPEELAASLMLDGVFVSRERYTTSATARSRIVPSSVLVFLAEANQTAEDPSNIKRFVSNTNGGTPFRVYQRQVNEKLTDITVEHYSNILPTANLGVQQLTITPTS